MNIHEIYNILLTGKTVQIPFASEKAAETFRVKLAQVKSRTDKTALGIGFMEDHERQMMSFRLERPMFPEKGEDFVATIKFQDKPVRKQYDVKIIDDEVQDEAAS